VKRRAPEAESRWGTTAVQPERTDPRDVTETTLLTKVPSGDEPRQREEQDGPKSVGSPRKYDRAPKRGLGARLRSGFAALGSLWPLLPILAVQGVFAWRLLVTKSAFLDEATYMWSGRVIADHVLHGTTAPQFETFFSGAPVLYPVLAAIASKIGGLTAARSLSLVFMLLTTTAVYLTGRRLHGALTGFFAAGLFAALGSTLHLSSFATFDAMALCLLAWSTFSVVRFACGDSRNALIYGAVLMVLADCTKYASLLWNPIIILLAASAGSGYAAWECSRSWNLQRFAMVSTTLMALAVVIGRAPYFSGFDQTTLQRAVSNTPSKEIITDVGTWIGVLLAAAVLGTLVSLVSLRRKTLTGAQVVTLALLLVAGLLAPANQLRIHTLVSLNKHVDFGASFAAIPAGFLLAKIVQLLGGSFRTSRVRYVLAVMVIAPAALVPSNITGSRVATGLHDAWPDSTAMIAALKPLVHKGNDKYLVEDDYVAAYYLPSIKPWQWQDTYSTTYYDAGTRTEITGVAAFKTAILAHEYKVIVLDYDDTTATDDAITGSILKAEYKRVARIPVTYGTHKVTYSIWTLP
jgi:Dolichyl-phosphate-mannose-protein mannosyltransferase